MASDAGWDMADLNHNGATAVALVSCSGLLGDLIRQAVASLPEVAVVEDLPFDDLRDVSAALHQAHPNVVVWLLDDETSIAEHTDRARQGLAEEAGEVADRLAGRRSRTP